MVGANDTQIKQYAELAFRTSRQKIDDEYQRDLLDALQKLSSHGMGHSSSGREVTELRLKAEKIAKLVLAKAEALLESYESHQLPIDEATIVKELSSLSIQSMGGASSAFKGEASLRAGRTGRHDPSLAAKASSFDREMQRRSHAALTEARHMIQKRKLAQNRPPTPPATVIHHEYHLHGANSRVNVQSTDQSVNAVYVRPDEVFDGLRAQLEAAVADAGTLAGILQHLSELRASQGTGKFAERLGTFLAFAANWTTVITPFLPALSEIARKALT